MMLAEFTTDHLVAIVIAVLAAAIPGSIAAVSSIKARRDVRTRNGKTAGETIHDAAQTLEVIQTQQHTNTRDIAGLQGSVDRVEEKIDRINGRTDRVDSKLDRHLTEVGEGVGKMTEWARRKMEEENREE
jgi:peptidoglycan hydrolase CwlO-like protein